MNGPYNADNIVAIGPKGRLEYAVRSSGRSDVKEWLIAQSNQTKASFEHLFNWLVNHGTPFPNPDHFKKIAGVDDVWEFKRKRDRIFCYKQGRHWLLTNHYAKGSSQKQTDAARQSVRIAREQIGAN